MMYRKSSTRSHISWYPALSFRKRIPLRFLCIHLDLYLISVIFFFNVALTALSLVIEQNDGTQERVWITGMCT